jgi:hypothetical protein
MIFILNTMQQNTLTLDSNSNIIKKKFIKVFFCICLLITNSSFAKIKNLGGIKATK